MIANNDLGKDDIASGFEYDAYGRIVRTRDDGGDGDASDSARRCLHQSAPRDDDELSALYRFRNRDHSPLPGRWVQQDPLGYVDGLSLYEYVQLGR